MMMMMMMMMYTLPDLRQFIMRAGRFFLVKLVLGLVDSVMNWQFNSHRVICIVML